MMKIEAEDDRGWSRELYLTALHPSVLDGLGDGVDDGAGAAAAAAADVIRTNVPVVTNLPYPCVVSELSEAMQHPTH